METLSLLSLLVLLAVAAASPLVAAAAWSWDSDDVILVSWSDESSVRCGERGSSYGANSTYEANLRRLAAVLPAETSASHARSRSYGGVGRAVGYWPNRVQARASCWTGGGDDCAACIAEAFKEVERECPFRREATFVGRNCNLRLAEFRISSSIYAYAYGRNTMVQILATAMIFQALGLACLVFLFIQAWRHDGKRGIMTRHTPLLSGDQ